MLRLFPLLPAAVLLLAACDPVSVTGADVRVSGGGGVGISTSGDYGYANRVSGGPPPGRTASERAARRDYYRGPRGQEF